MTGSADDIRTAVRQAFADQPPTRLGVAVSGGGDSIALLHILMHCFEDTAVDLHVATVDHGLRPESRQEARWVAEFCARYGLAHSILTWNGWDGTGNLQATARDARYRLLAEWAQAYGICEIALGHTADDQAETLLMRLTRASGVDGMTGMSPRRVHNGVQLVRPMLGLGRDSLRAYLRAHDIEWIEDPSNDDTAFDRIKARQALEVLAPLGLTVQSLADTARHMEDARSALNWYGFLAARDCVQINGGDVLIEHRMLRTLPQEILRRILIHALKWVGGGTYAPRSAPMTELTEAARDRRPGTLAGCQMLHHGPHVWICREYNALRKTEAAAGAIWDNRWTLTPPLLSAVSTQGSGHAAEPPNVGPLTVRALGRRGIMECPDWRETGRPYASLLSSPAVWSGKDLVAAPFAGEPAGWSVSPARDDEEFFASLIAH